MIFKRVKISIVIVASIVSLNANAQQQTQYSQYLYSLFSVNPAYAGNKNYVQTLLSERYQWVGVEGAPHSQSIAIHSPLKNNKMGIGINLYNESIGAHSFMGVLGSYSYTLKSEYSSLSFGLRGGVYNYRINLNKVQYKDELDPNSLALLQSKLIPNFDFGMHYFRKKIIAGFTISNLLKERLYNNNTVNSTLDKHVFTYFGYLIGINDSWRFKPSTMIKITKNAPINADINAGFIYKNKVHFGLSYRTSNSIVPMIEIYLNRNLHFGYSYDYDLNFISKTGSTGTHELILGIDFNHKKTAILSPRYL